MMSKAKIMLLYNKDLYEDAIQVHACPLSSLIQEPTKRKQKLRKKKNIKDFSFIIFLLIRGIFVLEKP